MRNNTKYWTSHLIFVVITHTSVAFGPPPAFIGTGYPCSGKQTVRDSGCRGTGLFSIFPGSNDSFEFPSDEGQDEDDDDGSVDHMDELRDRILKNNVLGPGMEKRPNDVHVILFGSSTGDEGIHTIEFPKGTGHNIVLAFESEIDCNDFADTLRDQEFFNPEPTKIHLRDLEENTSMMGVDVQLVPSGTELLAPSVSVDDLNFNPRAAEEIEQIRRIFQMSHDKEDFGTTDDDVDDVSSGSWE